MGPKGKPGPDQLKEKARSRSAWPLPYRILERTQNTWCAILPQRGFLESAQRLSVRTYHNMDLNCSQTLARERHAHRWPSMVRGAMLARTRRAWGYCDSSGEREGTQLSAWERSQPLRRERHAHRWPSMVREQCWLDQPGEHEAAVTAPESRELNSQHEREPRRSEGSGMLIGDPLRWGEQC